MQAKNAVTKKEYTNELLRLVRIKTIEETDQGPGHHKKQAEMIGHGPGRASRVYRFCWDGWRLAVCHSPPIRFRVRGEMIR